MPTLPDLQKTIDSRNNVSILPKNVMVIYDSSNGSGISPVNTATAYCTARGIPTSNLLGIDFSTVSGVANFYQVQGITKNQCRLITSVVLNAVRSCGNPIVCFVFVGDFPANITDLTFDTSHPVGFFDCFNGLEYFQYSSFTSPGYPGYTDIFNLKDLKNLYWDGYKYNPNYPDWHFSTATMYYATDRSPNPNMWFNPTSLLNSTIMTFNGLQVTCFGRISACLPLTPFVGSTHTQVSDLWTKAIAAEQSKYTDWGTALLHTGVLQNPSSRQFLEEQKYEGLSTAKTYYTGFNSADAESGIAVAGPPYDNPLFYVPIADYDPNNWTRMPGEDIPTVPNDVFFVCPGNQAYYSPLRRPEVYGDYSYRNGAITVFPQSYGASPQSGCNTTVLPNETSLTLAPSGPTPLYVEVLTSSRVHLDVNGAIGGIQLSYNGDQSDGYSVTIDTTTVTITKTGTGTVFAVSVTGKTFYEFLGSLYTNILTVPKLQISVSTVYQSRCAAAVASGATCSFGVTTEPVNIGDTTSYGLLTNLWYGGNLAEWLMKLYGGYITPNYQIGVQYPRAWILYGDPLYAPFAWRKGLNMALQWDSTVNWDEGYPWDNSGTILNPSWNTLNTNSFIENVLSNTNK